MEITLPRWGKVRISDISVDVCAGATPNTRVVEFWENGNIPWMSSGEINNEVIKSTTSFITQSGFESSSTKMIPINSVLIALAGQGKTRGKVAINKIELCTNQSLAAIIPNHRVHYEYLFYYLQSNYTKLRDLSSGDGGRGGLNLKLINGFRLDLPPIMEQKKIAEILSTWDEAIILANSLISQYQNQYDSTVTLILKNKNAFNSLDDWHEVQLGKLIAEVSDKSTVDNQYPVLTSSRKGIYLQEEYFKKIVASSESLGYKIIRKGEFTFRTMSDDGSFKFNRLEEYSVGVVSPAYVVFKAVNIEPRFLNIYMNSHIFTKEIAKASQGGTRLSLKYKSLSNFKIVVPSHEAQSKIADFFEVLHQYINQLNKYKEQLIIQKQGLIQQLLTGKIRVKVN